MKVLVLGGGGREHALAWRLNRDPDVSRVFAAPGNPGIAAEASCLPVRLDDPAGMLDLARREGVDLTIVGPEGPLERGVADLFRQHGCPILGPSKAGAALECSKVYAKAFMARHGIPTARFLACESLADALAAVAGPEFGFPVVIKADGLAAGKGVTIAGDRAEAEQAVRDAMEDRRFGQAGSRLVIEECMTGPEVSFFVLCDGERAHQLSSAEDHKRIGDDDRGPNTGGMGAYAPSPRLTSALANDVMARIVQPVLDGLRAEGAPYQGFLYIGLMLTPEGPRVVEFNVRFGDPEAQVVLPQLEGRFARVLLAAAEGRLEAEAALTLNTDRFVGVVMASRGYPNAADASRPIRGLKAAAAVSNALVFHAGTRLSNGILETAGGRVLTVVGRGGSYESAMKAAYAAVSAISFDGMQFRTDIGRKAVALGTEVGE